MSALFRWKELWVVSSALEKYHIIDPTVEVPPSKNVDILQKNLFRPQTMHPHSSWWKLLGGKSSTVAMNPRPWNISHIDWLHEEPHIWPQEIIEYPLNALDSLHLHIWGFSSPVNKEDAMATMSCWLFPQSSFILPICLEKSISFESHMKWTLNLWFWMNFNPWSKLINP